MQDGGLHMSNANFSAWHLHLGEGGRGGLKFLGIVQILAGALEKLQEHFSSSIQLKALLMPLIHPNPDIRLLSEGAVIDGRAILSDHLSDKA